MTSSNRYLKLVCLVTALLLAMFAPDMGVWAGTTGKISGVVVDASSGEALPGANVVIVGSTMGASTNMEGQFFILNVPPGEYSVRSTMMGFATTVQQQVRVTVDRTTKVDFKLSSAVLDMGQEVVVTASRPLVEADVSSTQSITTPESAENMPVSDIMDAVSLQPGVNITSNEMKIEVRGGGSDEISFQVDGMERNDKLNDKIYMETNSASVAEIQVMTGGFNAEYGNIRSGLFNVITKEGSKKISGSVDYRMGPAHQKHFGPDAYGQDQYDYKLYAGANSFDPVMDVEGNQMFGGWNQIAVTQNSAAFMGKSDWTPQELQEVWKYRHRPIEYHENPDHFLDAGIGGPLAFLDAVGLKDAGFFAGYKFTREYPILPSVSDYFQNDVKELKLNFKPTQAIKVVLSGMYGKTATSAEGDNWTNSGQEWKMDYTNDVFASAVGRDKYYLAANNLLDVWNKQFGAKITHTLSPSTYYELKYNLFTTNSETGKSAARNTADQVQIGGVWFDESPIGWVDETTTFADFPGVYDFYGGALVADTSKVVSQKINFDLTSQVNNNNLVKIGFEFGSDHVKRDYMRHSTINLAGGDFYSFDRTPVHYSGYIQDKIEYGGMIANIGVRLDHYDANGYIYDPGNTYSMLYSVGGTVGYDKPDDMPKEASKAYTYISPRIGFSHPVRKNTKFFFNYGTFYSEPSNSMRFGLNSSNFPFANAQGHVGRVGNPNLEAPRTSMYEIGFEQSIANVWTVRTNFYAKDNSELVGSIGVEGLSRGYTGGHFFNYIGGGSGASSYNTRVNNQYSDIRGIEIKINKLRGRYFTGWINMDYLIKVSGQYGEQKLSQDPFIAYYAYSAVKQQPQTQPSFIANLDFHTPSDWGTLKGDWRLSVIQTWAAGSKYIYNPTGLPTREVRSIYYWVNNYVTNLRINKTFSVLGNRSVRLYMDINNLFNYRDLNLDILDSSEKDRYLTQVIDDENGLDKEIGEYKDDKGNNVFTENWIDSNGTERSPIAPAKDFALFYNPRSVLFGIKFVF